MNSLASSEKCFGMLPRAAAASRQERDRLRRIYAHLASLRTGIADGAQPKRAVTARSNVPWLARVRMSIGRMPPAFSEGQIPEHSPHCWHFQIGLSARIRSRSAVPAREVFTFRASAPPDFTLCFYPI